MTEPNQAPLLRGHLAATVFGAIMPLSLAPWDWWVLGIFSVAGLVVLLKDLSPAASFWRSFFYGLGMFATGASWVYVSIHEHGHAPIALAAGMTSAFVLLLALVFAVPFILYGALNRHPVCTLFGFPSIWILGEIWRGWILTGFPWVYLGYGHIDSWLVGWAPVGGVFAISWIAAFCGALLALATEKKQRRGLVVSNGAFIALLLWFGGWYLSSQSWTSPMSKPLSVGLLQPAIPLNVKWDRTQLKNILASYRQDTELLMDQELIIWPESAIPQFKHEVSGFLSSMNSMLEEQNRSLIVGIPTRSPSSNDYYNSVIGLGNAEGIYHKRHLVPFGEYLPLESLIRGTIEFFDLPMSGFSPGSEDQKMITASGFNISTSICYEVAYPDLVIETAKTANLLLTVSNDTWFGRSIGPQQHFEMARMRAAENRKPMIRATNDGISALINADGKVITDIPQYSRNVLRGQLSPRSGHTPFSDWGSTPIALFALIVLILAALSKSRAETDPLRKNSAPG